MISPAQLKVRQNFIGASDAAAAIGLNPWKTPLDLWLEKTGQAEPFNGNEQTYWGNVLEPIVAARLAQETDRKVRRHGMTQISKVFPHMACHLDFKATGKPIIIEIKTGGYWARNDWGESGSDQIPDMVLIQVTHQMIVTGYKKALVGVLLGGQEFRHYALDFDDDLAQMIVKKEREFWQYVIEKTPPPPATLNDLKSLYPNDNGLSIEAPESIIQLVESLKEAKFNSNEAAAQVEVLEIQLKNFMGANSLLTDSLGNPLVTWRNQSTNRIDTTQLKKQHPEIALACTKATESRVLRLQK
jgi:putative phage-type endonuclease